MANDGFLASLSDLASAQISKIASAAGDAVSDSINPTRSSNTAPTPDLTSQAATPGASFVSSSMKGVSIPLILAGVGLLAFLLLKRRR